MRTWPKMRMMRQKTFHSSFNTKISWLVIWFNKCTFWFNLRKRNLDEINCVLISLMFKRLLKFLGQLSRSSTENIKVKLDWLRKKKPEKILHLQKVCHLDAILRQCQTFTFIFFFQKMCAFIYNIHTVKCAKIQEKIYKFCTYLWNL